MTTAEDQEGCGPDGPAMNTVIHSRLRAAVEETRQLVPAQCQRDQGGDSNEAGDRVSRPTAGARTPVTGSGYLDQP
ncbi:hypothetical protein BH23ACT2_BH23ACT2_11240 [soil metagenome]